MQITCPSCASAYDVPAAAIGPNGRRVRCRACGASWLEPPRVPAPPAPVAAPVEPAVAPAPAPLPEPAPARRGRRVPWLLLGLGGAVVAAGAAAAMVAWGPDEVAGHLGLADRRSALGISITRTPDWRLIAGGSQLFAVSGRIWNPTDRIQPVPDIRAELKDARGRTVYRWTIARPVARLGPGASTGFDGAAVDVPPSSANVSVALAGTDE